MTRTLAATGALAGLAGAQDFELRRRPIPKAGEKAPIPEGRPLRLGVIGTGGMGGGHLRALIEANSAKREQLEVLAVCDVCKPRLDGAQKLAREKQPGVAVDSYRDYRDVLARDDLDAVLIASPEHWHAQMAAEAIAARKDVYLEKPMTLRLGEALWLEQVMEANPGMRLQVGTQYMTYEKYHLAREWIAKGRIGHPTSSQTSFCRNSRDGEWLYRIDPEVRPGEMLDWDLWCGPLGPREWDTQIFHRWRRYRDFSTGIVGDIMVHMMTPLLFALDVGWPVRVVACGGHYVDKEMENHDQVNLTVEFEKGHTLFAAGSTCNENGLVPTIRGHRGNLMFSGNQIEFRPERVFVDEDDPETKKCQENSPQETLRLDWLRSVRTRAPNISQVGLATQVMVIVDLATRSMWEGSAFRFDPATRSSSRA